MAMFMIALCNAKKQNYKNTYCKKDLYGNDRIIITQVL